MMLLVLPTYRYLANVFSINTWLAYIWKFIGTLSMYCQHIGSLPIYANVFSTCGDLAKYFQHIESEAPTYKTLTTNAKVYTFQRAVTNISCRTI